MAEFDISGLFTNDNSQRKSGKRGRPRKSQDQQQSSQHQQDNTFTIMAQDYGFTEHTIRVLQQEDFDSFQMLTIMTEQDISSLGISLGQKALVRKCIQEVKNNRALSQLSGVKSGQPSHSLSPAEVIAQLSGSGIKPTEAGPDLTLDGKHTDLLNVPLKDKVKRTLQRPHEFIPGKKGLADLSLLELIYGNLLMVENAVIEGNDEVLAMTRHTSFLLLKGIQSYQARSIVEYDYAMRQKLEACSEPWPVTSDADLCNRHLKLNTNHSRQQSAMAYGKPEVKSKGTNAYNNRCIRWNNSEDGNCRMKFCRFEHLCLICGEDHPMVRCARMTEGKDSKPTSTR